MSYYNCSWCWSCWCYSCRLLGLWPRLLVKIGAICSLTWLIAWNHCWGLLTHLLISVGNNDTNHVIGIRRASRLVPLTLLCNDLLFICWPRKISWKKWQNLRVRHCILPYHIVIRHVCSPAGSPQSGSLRVWVRKSTNACTIWGGVSSTTSVGCLGMFWTYPYCLNTLSGKWRYTLRTPHIIQPEYQKTSSKPWISLCSSYDLQCNSPIFTRFILLFIYVCFYVLICD